MATRSNQNKTVASHNSTETTGAVPDTKGKAKTLVANTGESRRPTNKRKKLATWIWVVGLLTTVWVLIALYLLLGSKGADQKPIATINSPDVHSLAFNPVEPDTVYFGSHTGLLKSIDGGHSWQSTLLKNQDAMGMGVGSNGKVIYISGHNVLMKSENGGQSWSSLLNHLPASDVHGLAIDAVNPAKLYVFIVGAGLFRSSDGGQSWQPVSNQLGNMVMGLAYGNNVLWAVVMDRGIVRSQDGGTTWEAASGFANSSLNSSSPVMTLAYDNTTNMLYAGTTDGLYHSSDGGTSWTKFPYNGSAAAVAVNPTNPKNLLLVSDKGEVYRSNDGGLSWPDK